MIKILLVDDSLFMRTAIKNILIRKGYLVVGEADSGKAGLEKYKALSPDAVLLDITMADMNGIDVLKEIMHYDPKASVFMVSAMGQKLIVQEAIMLGAKGFLVKPVTEEAIVFALSNL